MVHVKLCMVVLVVDLYQKNIVFRDHKCGECQTLQGSTGRRLVSACTFFSDRDCI